jgi:hypothetical protein
VRSTAPCTNRTWRGFGQIRKTAKPKSRHLPRSTAGDFATTATDSARSLIKSPLAKNPCDGAFSKSAVFRIGLLSSDAGRPTETKLSPAGRRGKHARGHRIRARWLQLTTGPVGFSLRLSTLRSCEQKPPSETQALRPAIAATRPLWRARQDPGRR